MKIGIIGMGFFGTQHYANAVKLGHDVRGYDPNIAEFASATNIYDWADAIVIVTPDSQHESDLRTAVERGKHVLVEKPISTEVGKLPELLALAKQKNLVVMMGNNLRFHPCVITAKSVIAEISPIWAHFNCAYKTLSEGAIVHSGVHEVDIAMHLFGPAQIIAATARLDTKHSDEIADFVLLHDNGIRSSFHIDHVTPVEVRNFVISGDRGNLTCHLNPRNCLFEYINKPSESLQHKGSWDDDYVSELESFIDQINGEHTLGATGEDGLATLRLLLEIKNKATVS